MMIEKFPQQKKLLSIIVPVYNEKHTINKILNKILKIKINKEIIVVNDGSFDGTKAQLKKFSKRKNIKIINLNQNYGKGYAIGKGLKKVNGKIIIIQDADLEYDPNDYKKLIKPILNKSFKFVIGSRVLTKKISRRPPGLIFKALVFVNKLFSILMSFTLNQTITDPQSCYKVFTSDIAKKLHLKENGFSFCNELIFNIHKMGIKIKEVPISYNGRSYKDGKKIKLSDGIKMFIYILKNIILINLKKII